MTTPVDETLFEDIVDGVEPMAHYVCYACYPQAEGQYNQPGIYGVCGVLLLNQPRRPEQELCEECVEMWPEHTMGHLWHR